MALQQSILRQKSDVRAGNDVTPEFTAFQNTSQKTKRDVSIVINIRCDKNIKSGISHRKS